MNGLITKQMAIDGVKSVRPCYDRWIKEVEKAIINLPEIYPETTYAGAANALLYLWTLDVLKDSEYYKIMDRLNRVYKTGKI